MTGPLWDGGIKKRVLGGNQTQDLGRGTSVTSPLLSMPCGGDHDPGGEWNPWSGNLVITRNANPPGTKPLVATPIPLYHAAVGSGKVEVMVIRGGKMRARQLLLLQVI